MKQQIDTFWSGNKKKYVRAHLTSLAKCLKVHTNVVPALADQNKFMCTDCGPGHTSLIIDNMLPRGKMNNNQNVNFSRITY